MLFKHITRCMVFLLAIGMVFSLLPVSALATNEETSNSTETATAEPNLLLEELQAEADKILLDYLGALEVTSEELQATIVAMAPDTCYEAYCRIVSLDAELESAYNEGQLTNREIEQFLMDNAMLMDFSNSIYNKAMEAAPNVSFLATNLTPITGVSVTDNNGSGSLSGTTVTITVTGGFLSTTTNTIKITNTSDKAATLSFQYSVSGQKSTTLPATSGDYSALLGAGEYYEFNVVAPMYKKTATLTLSNFNLVEAATSSNITINFNSNLGSVTAAGASVTSGSTVEGVSLTEGIALAATASSSTFLGWIDGTTHDLLSSSTSYTYKPASNSTVIAAFAGADSDAWFLVGTKYYDDLNEAANAALTGGGTVILAHDGTLPSGDYTIPAEVTLLIPYDDNNTLCTTKPTVVTSGITLISLTTESWKKPTVYRTLKMAYGANITVNGAMSLSGKSSAQMGYNGCPSEKLSFVNMASGSNITVNSSAFLYVWGYITGSGTITVKKGGTVYEDFQVKDWRGGSAASGMINKDQRVFPVSQYYVQNVEVPMALESGASEFCYMSLVASKVFGDTTVPFIGGSGMFQNSGTIVKDYNESTDRLEVEVNGNLTMSNLNLEISSYKMNSANYVLPVTNNMTVNIVSGTVTASQDMCMLPGCEVVIGEDATFALASGISFFTYDADEWVGKSYVYSNRDVSPLPYVGAKLGAPAERAALTDAKIVVNGTLDASLGYLYTTTGGANITSDGSGKTIIGTNGTSKITYQATQSGTTISFVEVSVTPAKLLNSDGSYVETAKKGAGTYYYAHGLWHKTDTKPIVTSKPTAPTCTEKGYTTHTCSSCDYKVVDSYVDATGHSYSKNTPSSKIVTEATCIAAATYYVQCDNCDYVNTNKTAAAGEVNPNNHTGETYLSGKVDATCTEPGYSGDTHCGGCKQKLSDGNTIIALGHTPAAAVQENVKKATCLEPGSYDSVIYCSVSNCGAELSRTTISVPAAGHTYVDGKCSVCGCVEVSFTIAHNLALKELVQIGYWVKAESTAEIKDVGILIWKEADYFAEDKHDISSDTAVNPAMTSRQGFMMGYGEGIYAQYLDTKYYAVPYVVTSDGSYVYSGTPDVYAAPTYALQMGKQPEKVKTVVRDLLNYGTYAQLYFDSRPDGDIDTSTRINDVLEDAQKKLRYSDTMLVEEITADKTAENTNLPCTWRYSTAELLDAIQLNFFADRNSAFTNMLHWNETDYTAANTMKKDNATTVLNIIDKSIVKGDDTVCGSISGIYPKNLTKWHYACMYNSADNTYGPLRVDSVACYLSRMISNLSQYAGQESEYGYLLETCKAMLAYGDSAKAYAGS